MIVPGGAYFNSGTVYFNAQAQFRGGIHNDNSSSPGRRRHLGRHLFPGSIGIGTTAPANKSTPPETSGPMVSSTGATA